MAVTAVHAASAAAPAAAPPAPPSAQKRPVTDTYHGVTVTDDYRWLENGGDPEVRAWSQAQNARTRQLLDALPARGGLKREIEQLVQTAQVGRGSLTEAAGMLFALKRQPPKNQPLLVRLDAAAVQAAAAGKPVREQVVLDPTVFDASGKTTIDWYVPSPDGKTVAVVLSANGSEDGSLHLFDSATGQALPDTVPRVQYPTGGGSAAWAADGKGFWYTRYPQGNERAAADANFYQQIYFHAVGTPPSEDRYVIGDAFPRIAEIRLDRSDDGRFVLADVANGDGGDHAFWLRGPDDRWQQIAGFDDGVRTMVFGKGADARLYGLALKGSPKGRVVALPLDKPVLADARLVVPEGDGVIEAVTPAATRLYVTTLVGGPSVVRTFALDGKPGATIGGDEIATIEAGAVIGGDRVLIGSESFVRPFTWFVHDPARDGASPGTPTLLSEAPAATFPPTDVVREFALSKDGTKVPVNIVGAKWMKLDGSHPTLLTAYGGYGISEKPFFSRLNILWLRHGGVFALANLRGGGEYGEAWHQAGMLTNKQHVFDDFIASAELLVQRRYTRPAKLAAQGGSNGGLLMGAVLTQRPDLFRAVVSQVGIYDMLRVELDPNGSFNTTEFGSVKDEAQFKALYAYSPYHRVTDGTAYPALLLTTGEHDGRVEPYMSRKFAARVQAANPSGQPVLLRIASDAGHGHGTALSSRIEEWADVEAFLFSQLGMR